MRCKKNDSTGFPESESNKKNPTSSKNLWLRNPFANPWVHWVPCSRPTGNSIAVFPIRDGRYFGVDALMATRVILVLGQSVLIFMISVEEEESFVKNSTHRCVLQPLLFPGASSNQPGHASKNRSCFTLGGGQTSGCLWCSHFIRSI